MIFQISSLHLASMDDGMHIYDAVGSQERGYNNKTERVTSFDNRKQYMTLYSPQKEGPSEYQEPQQRATRAVVNNDEVKGSSDCYVLKDELKQMKKCLCMLSLLIVIFFLITVASLGLAAYGFDSRRSLTTTDQEIHQLKSLVTNLDNDTNLEIISLISLQGTVNMIESRINVTSQEVASLISLRTAVNDLESRLNTVNSEVITQRTTLESQFNTTNAELVSQRTFINNLGSRLNTEMTSRINSDNNLGSRLNTEVTSLMNTLESRLNGNITSLQRQFSMNISSLQTALRSQPSMIYPLNVKGTVSGYKCIFSNGSQMRIPNF